MGFYQKRLLPHLIHLTMGSTRLVPYRERVVAPAEGRVLEIGVGSGHNLPYYRTQARAIVGLEPSPRLVEMASARSLPRVSFIEGSAEAIPLAGGSVDTVVMTWTLCSIPDAVSALREMRRVLRPGGRLRFVEHGLAPEAGVRKWQDRLTPAWKRIGGGCHLNRPIRSLIEAAGFDIVQLETGYMRGPKTVAFLYEGCAVPG